MTIKKFLDLVVCGPDFSGTSTQISDIIEYFIGKKYCVRDIRGTEMDALFHADVFRKYNAGFVSFKQFLDSKEHNTQLVDVLFEMYSILSGYNKGSDLAVASMIRNKHTQFVDPDSADVWIMEEPTRRGSGQVCRTLETQRNAFNSKDDPISAANAHQSYRSDEFFRFRKILREHGKIIIRSRSEESACYQIYDKNVLPSGIKMKQYLALPGNKIAFANPPTHIFVVCGHANWNREDYIEFKKTRSSGRLVIDDYENNTDFQLLVNSRYASSWIERLYNTGCKAGGTFVPVIERFDITDPKENIKFQISYKLENILIEKKILG